MEPNQGVAVTQTLAWVTQGRPPKDPCFDQQEATAPGKGKRKRNRPTWDPAPIHGQQCHDTQKTISDNGSPHHDTPEAVNQGKRQLLGSAPYGASLAMRQVEHPGNHRASLGRA
jgi:hypothetical protein